MHLKKKVKLKLWYNVTDSAECGVDSDISTGDCSNNDHEDSCEVVVSGSDSDIAGPE